jgi:hypothetical protein
VWVGKKVRYMGSIKESKTGFVVEMAPSDLLPQQTKEILGYVQMDLYMLTPEQLTNLFNERLSDICWEPLDDDVMLQYAKDLSNIATVLGDNCDRHTRSTVEFYTNEEANASKE